MTQLHIRLRELRKEDIPLLAQWTQDPEVMKHVTNGLTFSLEDEYNWFEAISRNAEEKVFAIELIEDNRLIGTCGIHDAQNKKEVGCGILIGDKHKWGKGYGTEVMQLLAAYAKETLGVKRMWLNVDDNHTGAIRAYEKAGFQICKTEKNPERINSHGYEHVMEMRFVS